MATRSATEKTCLDDEPKNDSRLAQFRQIYAALVVNILSVSNGVSAGWTSPVELVLRAPNNPIRPQPITEESFSWASSILYLGGLAGTFVWNDLADRYGRKFNGYAIAGTQIVSWLWIMVAGTPAELVLARFLMGMGGAGIIVHAQLYTNETASFKLKGRLCTLISVNTNLGLLLVSILGCYASYQTLNLVCFAIPILFCALFARLPESPLYLCAENRPAQARAALVWFRGGGGGGDADTVTGELLVLEEATRRTRESKRAKPIPYGELVRNRANLRATIVASVLLMGQRLSGRPVVFAYQVDLFALTRTSVSPHLSSVIVNALQFAVACTATFATGAAGGRRLLCLTYVGTCLSCVALSAFCTLHPDPQKWHFAKWIPTASVILFLVCCNLGVLPVTYMMLPHLFAPHVLNKGLSVSLLASIFASFATVKVFPTLKRVCGDGGSIAVFAVFNAALASFVAFCLPDDDPEKETTTTRTTQTTERQQPADG